MTLTSAQQATDLLAMSHGVAILLLILYLGYLLFQMWTHAVSLEPFPQSRSPCDTSVYIRSCRELLVPLIS
jgi:Ca2+/H+ antiporter